MVIRPDKNNEGLVEFLQEMADKKKWSLNKYVVVLLSNHRKKSKSK